MLRNFDKSLDSVKCTYEKMHQHQTLLFVLNKQRQWLQFDHGKFTIFEILDMLNSFVDESDPDVEFPNIFHNFQTAEALRVDFPDDDWLHLVGFLHDLGKILAVWGEPQWCVVGDTFPVGCAHSEFCIFPESFSLSTDSTHVVYSTKLGIYKENCGLKKLIMSWGHDEYLYRVLLHNGCTLPAIGLDIIRYHSFYPLHTHGAYEYFLQDSDYDIVRWLQLFNKYDLYTKKNEMPDIDQLTSYYSSLLVKYSVGGRLAW